MSADNGSSMFAHTHELCLGCHATEDAVAAARAASRATPQTLDGATCPCTLVEPCSTSCTCASSLMSGGCMYCATYGSREQQLAAARRIARALSPRTDGVPATKLCADCGTTSKEHDVFTRCAPCDVDLCVDCADEHTGHAAPGADGPGAGEATCPKEATNKPGCRPFMARQFCSDECWTAGHHVEPGAIQGVRPARERRNGWLVMLKREIDPWDVSPHDTLEAAQEFADRAGAQWSEVYVVEVVTGPRDVVAARANKETP